MSPFLSRSMLVASSFFAAASFFLRLPPSLASAAAAAHLHSSSSFAVYDIHHTIRRTCGSAFNHITSTTLSLLLQMDRSAVRMSEPAASSPQLLVNAFTVVVVGMALLLGLPLCWRRRRRRQSIGGGECDHKEASRNFQRFHDWCYSLFSDDRRTIALRLDGSPAADLGVGAAGGGRKPGSVTFLTVDPANLEHILKFNFANYPKGDKTREKMRDLMGDGIFNVDGDKWRIQRRIASAIFTGKSLKDYSLGCFREDAVRLLHVLRDVAVPAVPPSSTEKKTVNIQALLMSMTMETICRVGFGVHQAVLPDGGGGESQAAAVAAASSSKMRMGGVSYAAFSEAFDKANECIARRYVNVWWKVHKWLRVGTEGVLRAELGKIEAFTAGLIQKRFADLKGGGGGKRPRKAATPPCTAATAPQQQQGKSDLLSYLIQTNAYSTDTITGLRDSILNFMIAGRDTIAVTMSWFIYNISQKEDVRQKVQQEIEDVLGFRKCVNKEGFNFQEVADRLTYETLSKLHYLHAALTETLRLHPAVPRDTKVALNDDVLPDGTIVKAGDHVAFVPYSMGRMKFLWGDDVLEFKPERWLKDGLFSPSSPFKFAVFQGGPRMCLGKDWAYLQMKMTMALFLHFFEFRVVSKDVKYRMMMILAIDNGLDVIVNARQCHCCGTFSST